MATISATGFCISDGSMSADWRGVAPLNVFKLFPGNYTRLMERVE